MVTSKKLTYVPKKYIIFILWNTVKQLGQEYERGKESWIFK